MTDDDITVDVHTHFGLSYANYMILHRTLLQSMPLDWQHRFIALVREMEAAYAHVDQSAEYNVVAGEWKYIGDCTDAELKAAGISGPHDGNEETYTDEEGRELQSHDYAFVPSQDPVPHYNRGRTHVEPCMDGS